MRASSIRHLVTRPALTSTPPKRLLPSVSHTGRPMAASASSTAPKFSEGADTAALDRALSPLLTASGGRWTLTADGQGLERPFKFKTFTKTWDFMTAVSLQCKIKNHHPEWSNVYNTTFIRWTTHNPRGLSAKDVDCAALCDSLANDFGELADTADAAQSCALQGLADRATSTAGDDCCTPKKS